MKLEEVLRYMKSKNTKRQFIESELKEDWENIVNALKNKVISKRQLWLVLREKGKSVGIDISYNYFLNILNDLLSSEFVDKENTGNSEVNKMNISNNEAKFVKDTQNERLGHKLKIEDVLND